MLNKFRRHEQIGFLAPMTPSEPSVGARLAPNVRQTVPLNHTGIVSRQLSKGSHLLVVPTINRSPHYQINHGTGKDVSVESIADAKEPLAVQ
jgi:hypothetical protein